MNKKRKRLPHVTKVICLCLVMLLAVPALFSCKTNTDAPNDSAQSDGEQTSDVSEPTDTSKKDTERYDENGYLMDDLHDLNLDYDGRQINFLAWEEVKYKEFEVKATEMSTTLNSAVYIRNRTVEQRLGVKLNYRTVLGNNYNMDSYINEATIGSMGDLDGFASYSRVAATLAITGLTTDLLQNEYIDVSKPWWSQGLADKCTIYDKLYFCSGDISPSLFSETYVMYYNKTLAETYFPNALSAYDAADIYELIEEGNWTLETFFALSKGFGLNSDSIKDYNDDYGFTIYPVQIDAFFTSSGLLALTNAADGSVMISRDMTDGKTHSLMTMLDDFFKDPVVYRSSYSDADDYQDIVYANWNSGKALFHLNAASYAADYFQKGMDFGLLVMPKYDKELEDYISGSGFFYTMYSIARNSTAPDAVGATLECLASEGYRTTAPALYETVLKKQSTTATEDLEMWDRIKNAISIDAGRVFDRFFEDKTWSIFRYELMSSSADWVSAYSNDAQYMENQAELLNQTILNIEAIYG